MSQYINFYLKYEDNFIPLDSFNRNSKVFEYIRGMIPFGKITPFSNANFLEVMKRAEKDIAKWKDYKQKDEILLQDILNAKNITIEDKMLVYGQINEVIEDYNEEITNGEEALAFFKVYLRIIKNATFYVDMDANHYIYVKIEV